MKKFTAVILMLVLTLSLLAGCRSGNSNDTTGGQDSQGTQGSQNTATQSSSIGDGIMDDFEGNGDVTDGNGIIGDDENPGRSGNGPMHR